MTSTQGRGWWDDPETVAEMVRLYVEEGLPIRKVAQAMGCSCGTVHHTLHTAQASARGNGRYAQHRRQP